MKKLIKDGLVAVIYSPGYGAGWYTWNTGYPQCVFSPEIAQLILDNKKDEITEELCKELFGTSYFCCFPSDLTVKWLPENTKFIIDEYDGYEGIELLDNINFLIA